LDYDFGELTGPETTKQKRPNQRDIPFIYTNKNRPDFKIVAKAGILWDEGLDVAINQGNLIHYILGTIYKTEDLESALQKALQKGLIKEMEVQGMREKVHSVLFHPELNRFYQGGLEVLNERELLLRDGSVQRPDRVILEKNHASIIDYKTGEQNTKYHQQLNTYAESFTAMGYVVDHKIIVYINSEIQIAYI
jgi:ATP-dependent exoDNAse (exonuclease V) beta subunit